MDFGETLLAAQRNQKDKNSDNAYYRTKFEPPKKEQKTASKLSANIQKFLAKKEEEERQKQDEARRKRDELLAMRDPKATKKIQKMLKVIKSANKSVLAEAIDTEHTAVTRTGAEQPDQDDYGYESQEAAALYKKMMEKYSKLPEEEKFPASKGKCTKKDLDGCRERMKAALQREDEPQPRQRKSKSHLHIEKEESPPPQPEKKPDKPKIRKPAPPPLDFNQLLKLAEQKKDEPIELPVTSNKIEQEPERPMTKRQKREFEEEQARREARRRRMMEQEAASSSNRKSEKPRSETQKKPESTFMRIPKIGEKNIPAAKVNKSSESTKQLAADYNGKINEKKPSSSSNIKQESQRNESKIELKNQNTYRIDHTPSGKPPVKINRDNDRVRNSKDEKEKNMIDEKRKLSKPYDRASGSRECDRSDKNNKHHQSLDRSYVMTEQDRNNKNQQSVDRIKVMKEQERNIKNQQYANRSKEIKEQDRNGKHQQSLDRSKVMKEQNRNKFSKDDNTGRSDSKLKSREEIKHNDISFKKKLVDPSRKHDVKDRVLMKEKKLFGSGSPKPNDISKDKYPIKLSDQKSKDIPKPDVKRPAILNKGKTNSSKIESGSFDFDKHVNSLKKAPVSRIMAGSSGRPAAGDVKRKYPPGDPRNKVPPKRPIVHSDSEYDSEMDDFIDDGEDDANYSEVIRDIFGYDKNKYRDLDDEDDAAMESSFAQQMREEYISKKIGIMEDLEDMKMEAMEKKRAKKRRRISDDDD